MNRSNLSLPFLLSACFFLLFFHEVSSQNITYQNPPEFFACDQASFGFTVQNTTGAALTGVTLTVNFTTTLGTPCGIEYVQGSVTSGVVEGNLSNLSAPQFQLPDLSAGATQSFSLMASANCQTAACIDNAEVFVNSITLNWNGGSTNVTTNPYVIDRALLVITNVANTVMTGTRGDVLHRKITIRNTRPGALSSFTFKDVYQPGINITSPQGTVVPSGPGVFELLLDASDFIAIGDGDGLFEFNETIILNEDIEITTCGLDEHSAVSNITVAWGCDGAECQQESVNAVVTFKLYTKAPQLAWEPIISVPECFCGPNGHPHGMKITNVGNGKALDIRLRVSQTPSYLGGFADTASIGVDSMNIPIDFEKQTFTNLDFDAPCDGPPGVAGGFSVLIGSLAPGASVIVHWDLYYCQMECIQPSAGWEYIYSYYKECPPNIFIQNPTPIVVGKTGIWMTSDAGIDSDSSLMDDHQYTVFYEVNYDSLALLNDELTVQIELPCGLEWVPSNEMLLNGQAPISIETEAVGTDFFITAVYQLPLTVDTGAMQFDVIFDCDALCNLPLLCDYELQSSCQNACPQGFGCEVYGKIITTINKCGAYPLDCNIQACTDFGKFIDCDNTETFVDAPPGYLRYGYSVLRKNYGLPDNNNDRIADAPTGLPDMNLVSRKRFIAGDTVQTILRGMVVIDQPGKTLPLGLLQLGFYGGNRMFQFNKDSLFTPQHFAPAGVSLRIFDSSTGTWFDCQNPAYTTTGKILYRYDLDHIFANCLPPGFALDQGDSLVFVGNYRIGYNPLFENDSDPLLGNILVEPRVVLYDADSTEYNLLNCNCDFQELLLSAYEFAITPGTFGLPPCQPSIFNTASLVRLQLHEGNFFPFEHRNLVVVEDLHVMVPQSIQICSTRMINLRLQDGAQLFTQVVFPPNLVNGQYIHDLLPFQTPSLDEGFSATFQYIFKNECTNQFSMPMKHGAIVNFAPGLPEPVDPLDFTIQTNALRPLIANLAIDAPLFDLTSFTNQLQFNFVLKNTPTLVGSQTSGPALNTWMYVTSQSGLVNNFQLINQTTGLPVPAVNGVWQLGNLPENASGFPYSLLGVNNSCDLEHLQIHYGWNCDPYQNIVQTPCYEQVQPLSIESPPGEIDMIVSSPVGCSQLCDTIPYHEIEVFNAQLGSVYDLRVKVLVPPGLTVIPGSSLVEYPTGSGLFYPIGDPTVLSTGVVEWNLSMLFDSIAGGLPGVIEAPFNSLTLRFLGETTCDFIADAYLLFIAEAQQNCGTPTNSIAKPGDPLCIDGVSSAFTTNINVITTPGFGCNNDVGFEVTLSASDTLPPGACLIMTLPPGITYQIGTCTSTCAPGLNCTPVIDGSLVTWQLPAGILPSQLLCLNFNTQGWAGLGCENGVVLFRTAAQTQALCALTGDSCSTKVSTGSLILPFDVMRPAYELSNFNITASASGGNDLVNFNLEVKNNGADNLPPLDIEFYLDTNGDGTGDQLVHTEIYGSLISSGQTVTVTGSFLLPSATNLCGLIALIDPTQQCACSGDQVLVATPIEYETGLSWTVCSGADQLIGVTPMSGFNYQWTPSDCLANATSPMTIFNCVNDDLNPVEYQFTLAEGNGFCEIQNGMTVTVQPVPGVAYADSPICQGESANLAATDGVSFAWQGPGIAQPNQQIITVTPTSTSQYSVTVTDAFGCSGTDQATVVVALPPIANAGPDVTSCIGQSVMLSANLNPHYFYLWTPITIGGQPALSDPTIPNPVVLTNQTTTFLLTVYNEEGCSAMDSVTVNFADSLLLTMPPDVTICAGNSTTLVATTNLPATFTWSPDGSCVNPPSCSSLLVSPTTTTTYTASPVTPDGCPASGSVTVTVVTDQIVENGPAIEICEGETTTIFGQSVSQPGIYCDTFTIAGGCDSLYCVELLLKPGIDTTLILDTICLGESVIFEGQTFTEEGEYCVSYPAPNGCDSTICLLLTVLDTAVFEIVFETDTLNLGDSLTLSIPPGNYTSILWMANDSLLADCTDSLSCTVFPTENTTYTATVTTPEGCGGSALQTITVIPDCDPEKVLIPNAFSPNGDSKNDSFNIVSLGSEVILNMRIWNRWGEKVFDGAGPWDGTQNGKPAPSDVYIYLIKLGCAVPVENMEKVLKGDVTLLR
ncbi:MAG: gliding motility-associated C-terminal domain-containing protein [Saprospiraceae bacterium]|nr:gliding motility-associated C-terminal domain-containing protein [Saprospiraceae bacterium]MCF8251256.1 gliding motility-associated C-terminal domain-containing protein [Saprospiraceae bacterium]MCF8283302.1 gliding motility-associated C-terminal domain-containing protein [Bacteroidales bacterium]MCF8311793.1 gliding motility-associated C-terminal domain-containing protein [Saprospiraceae bacterium]MCF8441757.1 gliding motility-associated C-terminal domain-containing protein [Saprospiraceae 